MKEYGRHMQRVAAGWQAAEGLDLIAERAKLCSAASILALFSALVTAPAGEPRDSIRSMIAEGRPRR